MEITIGGWTISGDGTAVKGVGVCRVSVVLDASGEFEAVFSDCGGSCVMRFEDFAEALCAGERWLRKRVLENSVFSED